jgi:hypothetical protein
LVIDRMSAADIILRRSMLRSTASFNGRLSPRTTRIPGRHLDLRPSSISPPAARIADCYPDCFAWPNRSQINQIKLRAPPHGTIEIET